MTTDNESLSINNDDAQISPPLCNNNLYSNNIDIITNENNSAKENDNNERPEANGIFLLLDFDPTLSDIEIKKLDDEV